MYYSGPGGPTSDLKNEIHFEKYFSMEFENESKLAKSKCFHFEKLVLSVSTHAEQLVTGIL